MLRAMDYSDQSAPGSARDPRSVWRIVDTLTGEPPATHPATYRSRQYVRRLVATLNAASGGYAAQFMDTRLLPRQIWRPDPGV